MRTLNSFVGVLSALVVGSYATACDLSAGLVDVGDALGNPDAALLDAPGRKLVDGQFRKITVDGSLAEGGKVIALQDTDDKTKVAVITYPDGDICYVDPAVDFDRVSSRLSVEIEGLFSVQRTQNDSGRGDISLVSFDCKEQFPKLTDTRLPRVLFPSEEPKGMLAIDGDGMLSMITPGAEKLREIETGVSVARTSQDYIFVSKSGRLVVYNRELERVKTFGDNVIDFIPHQGTHLALAMMDATGLSVWNEEDGVQLLSASACSPTFWGPDMLAYFDPCDERKLQVYTLVDKFTLDDDALEPDDFITFDGPTGVASLDKRNFILETNEHSTFFTFLLGDANAEVGALAVASVANNAKVKNGHTSLDVTQLSDEKTTFIGTEVLTHYDGTSGTLVEFQFDKDGKPADLVPLAERVTRLFGGSANSARGILADFDGIVGNLIKLEQGDDGPIVTTLASKVPNQATEVEAETGRWSVLADSPDGATGTLYLSNTKGTSTEAIAEDVLRNSARFLEEPRGIAYLVANTKSTAAKLKVYLLDSGLTITVHNAVNEYRPLPWPSPGILYSVPEGKDQGLWYAKAR